MKKKTWYRLAVAAFTFSLLAFPAQAQAHSQRVPILQCLPDCYFIVQP